MWFTNYPGANWTPDKGYNEVFAENVKMVRAYFQLQKTNTAGQEVGTGYWRPFKGRSGQYYVCVDQFVWSGYRQVERNLTPVFRFSMRLGSRSGQTATKYPLEITFPVNYPGSHPVFSVDDSRFRSAGGHDHHMLSGGVLCVGFDSWNPKKDTIVSALNMALDHLTWHLQKFGW